MISVLNRPNELRTHVKAALTNGVGRDEIREISLQLASYAGMPTAVDSFRIAWPRSNAEGAYRQRENGIILIKERYSPISRQYP
ncbi:carboxymuconolactone decarboxylase family protein [Mycobacterium palustre]|nr:carboxymuconolactone decarboxylase family protein [Mycobacterium palustre]